MKDKIKLHTLPWCEVCRKSLVLKIVGPMAYMYCETVSCKQAGSQIRIEREKLNGATNKARVEGLLR